MSSPLGMVVESSVEVPRSRRSSSIIWAVEGNICSGKTTLCRKARDQAKFRNAPLNFLGETANPDALGMLYRNPKKYAFWYQTYMLSTRMYNTARAMELSQLKHSDTSPQESWLFDRSVLGDYVFAIQNYLDGNISEEEFRVYDSIRIERGFPCLAVELTTLIYLDCDPKECHRRLIEVRSNEEESTVPFEYLDSLDNTYVNTIIFLLATSDIDVIVLPQAHGRFEHDSVLDLVLSGEDQHREREKYPRRPNVQFVSEGKHSLGLMHSRESLINPVSSQSCLIPKAGEGLSSPRSVLDNEIQSKCGADECARVERRLSRGAVDADKSYIIPCYFGDDTSSRFIRENFLKTPHTNQWRRQVMSLLSQGKDIIFCEVASPELEIDFACKAPESLSKSVVV